MRIRLLLCSAILLSGCMRYDYLDPHGRGKVYTVANPCPVAYRVLEVRTPRDHSVRIEVSALRAGEYDVKDTTLFVVVSDRRVFGYQVGRFQVPTTKKNHDISFPNGTSVKVTFSDGTITEGRFNVSANGLLLSYPISPKSIDEFTADLPPIMIDGELIDIGQVVFKRASATLYAINC
jgi:hypothetical protein